MKFERSRDGTPKNLARSVPEGIVPSLLLQMLV